LGYKISNHNPGINNILGKKSSENAAAYLQNLDRYGSRVRNNTITLRVADFAEKAEYFEN